MGVFVEEAVEAEDFEVEHAEVADDCHVSQQFDA